MTRQPLALHLEPRSSTPWPAGIVVLVNSGSMDVRVWRAGNQWGDDVLSFGVLRAGGTVRFLRRPQVYTRNVPSSVLVPAGGCHEWPFDLGDGTWEAQPPIDQPAGDDAQLVAMYDVSPSPEAVSHGVWMGQLRSEPVPLSRSMPGRPG